jgi:UDP-glucose 4-epimerase
VVDALVRLLDEPGAEGDVFNVGSSEEISIEQLAKLVITRTGSSSKLVHLPYDVAYEAGFEDMARRVPDVAKVRELTGWRAKRRLVDVLDDVIAEVRAEYALARDT